MIIRGKKVKIEFWRVARISFAVIVSVFVGYEFQPKISNNPDAINTVVTIFSILAGFLIAVITIIPEPVMRQARSWEELQLMKPVIKNQLRRHEIVFFFYLFTLGVALAMYITPDDLCLVHKWLEMLFLFLATFVFLISFTLPGSLTKMQMERYEAALKDIKENGKSRD